MSQPTSARKLLFLRRGLYSYSNESTAAQLRRCFPEYPLIDVDMGADFDFGRACLQRHPVYFFLNLAQAWRLYGKLIRTGKLSLRNAFGRTPKYLHAVRDEVQRRFAHRAEEFAFTFQTQSLFDGHLPGVPHFLFMDHTHLANLTYPSFDRALLAGADWVAEERAMYHSATRVFTMAEHVRQSVVRDYGVKEERVFTVHAGSNLNVAPGALANNGFRNQTIVFVGVDWERKGGEALFAAFEKVLHHLPEARLIVVGCRPEIAHPRVEIVGRVPREQVGEYLAQAAVCCLPSRIEPFGIAPIEAALQGVPSVVSDIGALPEIVRDGETGRVVPVDDVEKLAEALLQLLSDPALCQRMGEAGQRHAKATYNWDEVGAKLRKHVTAALEAGE